MVVQFDLEHVRSLYSRGTSAAAIAHVFGCCPRTVLRYIKKHKLCKGEFSISGNDVDFLIETLSRIKPRWGIKIVQGFLRANGVHVPRMQIIKSMQRSTPDLLVARCQQRLRRRVYQIDGPLRLVHLDGNHKLVRAGIVIHGLTDGYSRKMLFLEASTDNKASTVLKHFVNVVSQHGLPKRVRGDQGGENWRVASFMVAARGATEHPFIAGPSTSNTRIERRWCDVFKDVTADSYWDMVELERDGLLSFSRPRDLYLFHLLYFKKLVRSCREYVDIWNNHSMRIPNPDGPTRSRTVTPNRLYEEGVAKYGSPEMILPREIEELYFESMDGVNDAPSVTCRRPNFQLSLPVEVELQIRLDSGVARSSKRQYMALRQYLISEGY